VRSYVYRHIRLDTMTPFYVGKGTGTRAYSRRDRNRHWNFVVNKHNYRVEIVKYFDDELKSLDFEKQLIAAYRSVNLKLTNMNEGGTGLTGRRHSEESKAKMRGPRPHQVPWNKGVKTPYGEEAVAKMTHKGGVNPMYGRAHSEESKHKMRINTLGQRHTDESKLKISRATSGKNNPRWIGYCHTPYGVFDTAVAAEKELNINKITVQYRCHSKSKRFSKWFFSKELQW